jgi:hypothetical protein
MLDFKNFIISAPIFQETEIKEEPKTSAPPESSPPSNTPPEKETNMEDEQSNNTPEKEETSNELSESTTPEPKEPSGESYQKTLISQEEQIYNPYSHQAIGLIDGYVQAIDDMHKLPSLENMSQLEDGQPVQQPGAANYQQSLKKLFFIRTDSTEKDYTVYFQLSHDKIRDVFCHFFDTRIESHNVHILFGTAMSLKDNNPQQIWRLNSLISSMQLSRAASITAYALGWLDATETLLWCFAPNRHISEDSYAVLTFDWNGFDYIASKKNIHKIDQQRYMDRFKNLGLLNDEECENYKNGDIITLTADEVADRLRQNNKTSS